MKHVFQNFTLVIISVVFSLFLLELGFRFYVTTLVGESALLYGIRDLRNFFNEIQIQKLAEYNKSVAELRLQSVARSATPGGDDGARGSQTEDAGAQGSPYVVPAGRPTVRDHDNIKAGYSKYHPGDVKSDFDEKGNQFSVRINNRGFRGRDITQQKDPGTIRVVTVGASSTFGYKNRDETTYPFQMERILNERCHRGGRYEVINLGIPHLTAKQMYNLVVHEALPLDPDVVTFYEGANDMDVHRAENKIASVIPYFLRYKSLVISFLVNVMANQFALFDESDVRNLLQTRGPKFLKWVSAIRDEAVRDNRIFIVANQQLKSIFVKDSEIRGVTYQDEFRVVRMILEKKGEIHYGGVNFLAHHEMMRRLEKWASQNSVPFVDVIAALDGRRDTLMSPVHLSAEGNAILASALADKILHFTCQDGSD